MPLFGKGKGNPELCTCSLEAKAHWVSSGFEKHEWQRDLDEKKRHDEVGNQISALTITSHESPRSLPLSPLFTSANDIMNSQPTSNEPDPSVLSDLPTSLQGITQLLLTDKTGKLVLAQPNAPPARSSTTINASQPAAAHSHPTPTSSRQQETSVPQNGEPRRPSKPTTQIAYQERALERLRDIEKGASDAISSLHIPANAPDGFDEEFIAKLDCAERTHTQLSYDIDRVRSTIDQVNQEKERVMEILSKLDNVISDLGNWVPQKAVMEKDLPAEDPETDPISIENGRYFDDPVNDLGILAQIMIMLAVTTHVIFGVAIAPVNWILGVARALVVTTITLFCPEGPDRDHSLETMTLEQLPSSVADALNQFSSLAHKTTVHAVCPKCKAIASPTYVRPGGVPTYPSHCRNRIPGSEDSQPCLEPLLEYRQGKPRPLRTFHTASFEDYIAREMTDPVVEQYGDDKCDRAYEASQGPAPDNITDPFEANFLRTFMSADGKTLFVQRPGTTARLVFAIHTDYFNPNGLRKRGATESIGIISLVNLALPPGIRNNPEHLFIYGIITGPKEPSMSENAYYLRPIINEALRGWNRGYQLQRTARHNSGRLVEWAIVMSINDLPQARNISGFPGHASKKLCTVCTLEGRDCIHNTNWQDWGKHDVKTKREKAFEWLYARTTKEQKAIFKEHGVRWSEFWRLPYWDPSRMLVVDGMHCILEGLVHYHCRYVLRHEDPKSQSSAGFAAAYSFPFPPYDPQIYAIPDDKAAGIADIPKIHRILTEPIAGSNSFTKDAILKRLTATHLHPLKFVAKSLNLPSELNIDGKKIPATDKSHFAEILFGWRKRQPHAIERDVLNSAQSDLKLIRDVAVKATHPSCLDAPPHNYGEFAAGTMKAAEWKVLATIYLAISYVLLWGDFSSSDPPAELAVQFEALKHTMALFQAVIIVCRFVVTDDDVDQYRTFLKYWVDNLHKVHPHTIGHPARPNIHISFHLADFLLLFGPLFHWWAFPFERLIGTIQRINTNHQIGGMLEGTILESYLLGANFRRALSRPNCPVIIQELNALLHKVYPKKRSDSHDAPSSTRPNADNIAYFHWHGATYSPSSTHLGNSVVCYRRPGDDNLSAGQIARIFTKDGQTTFEIQRHQSLTPNQHDPFVRFPYLRATTWATTLESAPEKIPLENIFAHGVRYDFSNNRSVIINLDSH